MRNHDLCAPNRAISLRLRVIRVANCTSLAIWDSMWSISEKLNILWFLVQEIGMAILAAIWISNRGSNRDSDLFALTAIWGKLWQFGLRDFKSLAICDLSGKVKRPCNRQFRKLMGFSRASLRHLLWHQNTVKQPFWVPWSFLRGDFLNPINFLNVELWVFYCLTNLWFALECRKHTNSYSDAPPLK